MQILLIVRIDLGTLCSCRDNQELLLLNMPTPVVRFMQGLNAFALN